MKEIRPVSVRLTHSVSNPRRDFLRKGLILGGTAAFAGLTACQDKNEEDVSPAEDLMREHGVLNRIMLIYDHCREQLMAKKEFSMEPLHAAAGLIRSFIEDYHEMLEEKFVFPRLINANQVPDQVQILFVQHHAGRTLTEQIILLSANKTPETPEKLAGLLDTFNRMYRPHEAREDTIIFPALRRVVSRNEYYSLGEDFEKKEHELFGSDGFESVVEKVAGLEKQLGIYDLSDFTPAV
jgi:hemerythrin-like domain-containing protein